MHECDSNLKEIGKMSLLNDQTEPKKKLIKKFRKKTKKKCKYATTAEQINLFPNKRPGNYIP